MDINKTPEQMLKDMMSLEKEMQTALSHEVKVGLLENTNDIVVIGATHEYGEPQRSWLNMPFDVKRKRIKAFIERMWDEVQSGKRKAMLALKLIGVEAENIVDEAFETGGFGRWPNIKEATKKRKGSTAILIDRGILRSSKTSVVVPAEKGKK